MARDMTLFVDDDGKAYHIYASEENQTLQIAELTDDYTAHSGRYVRAFVGRSMEAPAIFKHDGKYYLMMSGCTGWAPNAARSAVADSVMGEWTELGNPCVGDDADKTFHSQSTYMLPVEGSDGTHYIYGRPLETRKRYRRTLHLAAAADRGWTIHPHMAARLETLNRNI